MSSDHEIINQIAIKSNEINDLISKLTKNKKSMRQPKNWSAHDCHSHTPGGHWAKLCRETNSYAVMITPSRDSKASATSVIKSSVTGNDLIVSKVRERRMRDLSVGDILELGDTHTGQVYTGTIVSKTGPFCPTEVSTKSSFIRSLGEPPGLHRDPSREVEVLFKVDKWALVGPLDAAARLRLRTSQQFTVAPIN